MRLGGAGPIAMSARTRRARNEEDRAGVTALRLDPLHRDCRPVIALSCAETAFTCAAGTFARKAGRKIRSVRAAVEQATNSSARAVRPAKARRLWPEPKRPGERERSGEPKRQRVSLLSSPPAPARRKGRDIRTWRWPSAASWVPVRSSQSEVKLYARPCSAACIGTGRRG